MSDLKVWTNDTDTVIAADLADVKRVIADHYGSDEFDEDDSWRLRSDERPLKIHNFDGNETAVTKTNAEWIASEGRGFLCSTEY